MTKRTAMAAAAGAGSTTSRETRVPSTWLRELETPKTGIPRIVARARRQPELIPALLGGLGSDSAPVKFGCSKALSLLSGQSPELLYPHFEFFLKQLNNENSILRWNAARVLACLAPADRENKLDAALDKLLSPISGPQMIAAANVIRWASEIAIAKPHLADRIASAILRVSGAVYQTDECRNVAAGHAIQSLRRFFDLIGDKRAVVAFVRAQTENPRPATRKKAQQFLKKYGDFSEVA